MSEIDTEPVPESVNPLNEEDSELFGQSSLTATQADELIKLDLGHMMAFNPRPVDQTKFKKDREAYLREQCQFGTQLIVNKLFRMPRERVDDILVIKLPKAIQTIPREKPLPKAKTPTKWEQYAKLKGIVKTKKGRKVWDDVAKEWRPTWGMNAVGDKTKQWCIPYTRNDDPNTDLFAKATGDKSERVAKNELQRLRNIARSTKTKGTNGPAITPTEIEKEKQKQNVPDKFQLKKQLHMAKTADASMSKFSEKIKDEEKTTRGLGKKRKFESNWNLGSEKEKQLKLFDKINSNKDKSNKEKLNIDKAANKFNRDQDIKNKSEGKQKKGGKRSKDGKHRRVSVKGKGKRK